MRLLVLIVVLLVGLPVPVRAGYDEGMAAYLRGDYATALRELRSPAEQGDAQAQAALGLMYLNGHGVPKDPAEAVRWYVRAAEQGEPGVPFGISMLDAIYLSGKANSEAYTELARWYRKVADQGDVEAQRRLGSMYFRGNGVPQDEVEAFSWFMKAAEQGDVWAQAIIGMAYYNGEGTQQDYTEGAKWSRKAATQGSAIAQYTLGLAHYDGKGAPQDYAEAVKWYRMAANQGHANAQFNLGLIYSQGKGVPQDFVQAHMWSNLAAAQGGDKATRTRNLLNSLMTPAQIAEAQRRAQEWRTRRRVAATSPSMVAPWTVASVQRGLASLGYYPGPADGILGPKTRAAIRAFEADSDLTITGEISRELNLIAGEIDLAALRARAARAKESLAEPK